MNKIIIMSMLAVSTFAHSSTIKDLEWCRDAVDQLSVVEQAINATRDSLDRESRSLDYWAGTIKGRAEVIDARRKLLLDSPPSLEEYSVFNRDVVIFNQDVAALQNAVASWNSRNSRLVTTIGDHKTASEVYFGRCNGATAPQSTLEKVCGKDYKMSANKFCASFAFK